MKEKRFAIFNKREELIAFSDSYDLVMLFVSMHKNLCKGCTVDKISKSKYLKLLDSHHELLIVEINDIIIREKDMSMFLKMQKEEISTMTSITIGLHRMIAWNTLSEKETKLALKTIRMINNYLDDEELLSKSSGIVDTVLNTDIADIDEMIRKMTH